MKRTLYETLEVFGITLFFYAVINYITGAEWYEIINVISESIVLIAATLIVDDICFKWHNYRKLLLWQYWVGVAIELVAIGAFLFARNSSTWPELIIGLSICILSIVGVLIWDFQVYNIVVFPPALENKLWKKERKSFRGYTDEKLMEVLSEKLRFKLVGDNLQGDIDFDNPFVDTLFSYDEMKKTETDTVLLNEVESYLKLLVTTRVVKEDK